MENPNNFIAIDWKEAKQLVESSQLTPIGSNLGQINNQGEYTISFDGGRLYKRRHTAPIAIYDLIAQK